MAKPRKNSAAAAANGNSTARTAAGDVGVRVKPKRTRKSVPREAPSQRSSVYRGVTRFVRQSNQPAGRSLGVLITR
jgi:AP2-like factor, ANT lineage